MLIHPNVTCTLRQNRFLNTYHGDVESIFPSPLRSSSREMTFDYLPGRGFICGLIVQPEQTSVYRHNFVTAALRRIYGGFPKVSVPMELTLTVRKARGGEPQGNEEQSSVDWQRLNKVVRRAHRPLAFDVTGLQPDTR